MVRKTVTVLFADVAGSTRMGERLDPEALRWVMTRYFDVSRATLERHGATVEKFIGDAVMAVFGVPAAHEDDALRAARAALELRRDVSALGIELRLGVNTGEVVAEDGETLVTGDAVNVAARLEQAASPGEILLGDATYRLARDALRVEALPSVDAKGKSEPVAVWRLLDVLDDAPAFSRHIDAPFVGRREQLAQLVASFQRAVKSHAAQRVSLLGAPGIGKVEGRFFHRGTVAELVPDELRIDVGAELLALIRKEFVRPDRAQLPGDDGYLFVHVLVRDAAYESMSKELRADLHERFADRLERVAPDRQGEPEEILAYHLEQSARFRRELGLRDDRRVGRRAADLLVRSGTRAYHRGDLSAAQNLLDRGAALLSEGDALRARTLSLLGAAIFDAAGGANRALEVLERALAESRASGDPAAEASAWATLQLLRVRGDPSVDMNEVQRESEERMLEIERLDDPRALVTLRRLELEISLATLVGVGEAAERLLAAARNADDRPNAFEALFFLTASLVFGPVPVGEALSDMRRFQLSAQGPIEEAAVQHIEGLLRGMAGELDEGLSVIRKGRETFVEFGMRLHAVGTARDEGLIARYAGDAAAVEQVLRPACDELRELGDTAILSLEVAELAEAYYELGRFDDADEAVGESERLAQHADVYPQVTWRRVRAKLLARGGKSDEALRLVNEAIEQAQEASALELRGDVHRDLAEVERIMGRTDGARYALERALAAYEEKGLAPMAKRVRAELEALRAGT